jgi:hypothetical protein
LRSIILSFVPDAIASGADTLVSIGGVQSNLHADLRGRCRHHSRREVEHHLLALRDIGLSVVDRHLVGNQGFFARIRRIAPWAMTQYWHWFAFEVATTIISRSAFARFPDFSIGASW